MFIEFFKKTLKDGLLIGNFGNVYSVTEKRMLNQMKSQQKKSCYYQVSFKGEVFSVHVLVATAFHKKPESKERLIVNHKDGNGLNNKASNLEWVTYSENSFHAYKTGLRDDNKITFVRDLKTKNVQRFYSQAEAARFIGCSPASITLHVNSKASKPILNRYEVRNDENWSGIKINPPLTKGIRHTVVVASKEKVLIFGTLTKAASYLAIDKRTLRTKMEKAISRGDGFFQHDDLTITHVDFLENLTKV